MFWLGGQPMGASHGAHRAHRAHRAVCVCRAGQEPHFAFCAQRRLSIAIAHKPLPRRPLLPIFTVFDKILD